MFLIGLLMSASATAAATTVSTNPLARAEKGLLQCYRPDVANKTCQSIASYLPTGPATYDNKALLPLGNGLTLETHSPVVVRDGAVCGTIKVEEVQAGTLRSGDQIAPPEQAKPILEKVAQAFAPMNGKEVCTRYVPFGEDYEANATIGGVERPDLRITVKWINPSDGYTVTP